MVTSKSYNERPGKKFAANASFRGVFIDDTDFKPSSYHLFVCGRPPPFADHRYVRTMRLRQHLVPNSSGTFSIVVRFK